MKDNCGSGEFTTDGMDLTDRSKREFDIRAIRGSYPCDPNAFAFFPSAPIGIVRGSKIRRGEQLP